MKQLRGLEASFLALESPTQTGHVASLAIFDIPEGAEDSVFPALTRALAPRIARLAPLRQRLVPVPLELDLPYWIEDRAFELDYHLRHSWLPRPGRDAQLAELVARLHGRPLDRTRPLWEMEVIEGLEGGRFALYTKVHHAALDRLGSLALLEALADGASAELPEASESDQDLRVPSALEMLARGALGATGRPRRALRRFARLAAAVVRSGNVGGVVTASGLLPFAHAAGLGRVPGLYRALGIGGEPDSESEQALPATPAPRTPWNRAISAHRRWTGFTLPLADLGRVRRAFGVSANATVLALAAHALRRELEIRGELPDDPMLAMVPVVLGTASENGPARYASMALTDLATNEPDPVRRLLRIDRALRSARRSHDGIPADLAQDLGRIGAGVLAGPARRALARTGLAERMRPPFTVWVSNTVGPRKELELAGARLRALFPLSIVTDGQGLHVSAISYGDRLHFGLTACRALVPELAELGDGFEHGLHELCKRAKALCARVVH
jgi:WS/DGAT/MGAT family acyltransferase